MLFRENSFERYISIYDTKKVEKIEKASQKILLNTQKLITKNFPKILEKWGKSQPNDPNGFELTRMFLKSSEFESVHNFSYKQGESTDIYSQFEKYIKKLNKTTFNKHVKFMFVDEKCLSCEEMSALVNLINSVYDNCESGLWIKDKKRVTEDELIEYISKKELLICRFNDRLIGCIRSIYLTSTISEFGMLAVLPQFRGYGVGRKLISLIEDKARMEGCSLMQLEIFDGSSSSHIDKVFLREWYKELGYKFLKNLDAYNKYEWVGENSLVKLKLELWQKNI